MHQIHYCYYWSIKNWSNLGQKVYFLAHLESFFVYTLLHSMSQATKSCQMKDLIKIYICGKFHQYSICGCEGKSFQNFSYWFSIHKMAPFFEFWALTPPNIVRSCWNFEQRKFSNKTKTVFEKSFKILNFGPNGTHLKFTVLVHFGAQFSTRKPKIFLSKFLQKLHP